MLNKPRDISIVLLLIAFFGCRGEPEDQAMTTSGHIEATQVRIASKVGGRLLEAPFEEGQWIEPGDVIARLETVDAEHVLAQARAEELAADAQLRLLLSGTRAEDLRRAEDYLATAQAELDAAHRDLTRLEGLADRGSATVKARDDARTRQQVAERTRAAAQAQLDKLLAGPRREEIEMARARKSALAAQISAVQQKIADAVLLAPRKGVITTRIAEPGEILAPGAPVCILSDLERPWLSVYVDEPNLSKVTLGNQVTVRVDGLDKNIQGTVSFVSTVAEFTPKNVQTPEERAKLVFRVKISLDNHSGLFKIGMPAVALFDGGDQS